MELDYLDALQCVSLFNCFNKIQISSNGCTTRGVYN